MIKLTPKQELFCQEYIKTGNASEAYRNSYNTLKTKPDVINVKASELLSNGKISVRVAELKNELAKKHDLTKDKIVNRLKEIIFEQEQLGVDKVDLNAMNKAIDTVNKMLGYNEPERIEHSGNLNHTIKIDWE